MCLIAYDANGLRVASAKLRVFLAGTATPTIAYTDRALTTPIAVPLAADASGIFRQIFLSPGISVKIDVRDSAELASLPNYPYDTIDPTPSASGVVEVTWTAGEAINFGNAMYLSDGSGGRTAGKAYKADNSNAYSSIFPEVAIAVADIANNASGTGRKGGQMSGLAGLTAGQPYYLGAAGALTVAVPATNVRRIGQAVSTTVLDIDGDPPSISAIGIERDLGGDPKDFITDTGFIPVPGLAIIRANLSAIKEAEVHVTAMVDAGTGVFRLFDITAAAQVGGTQNIVNTGSFDITTLVGLGGLFPDAVHNYRLEVKCTAATDRLCVSKAKLVCK